MDHSDLLRVRIAPELKEAARAKAQAMGEDLSDFVRTALKHAINDYRAPSRAELAKFNQLCREIDGAATNINQMARAANQARLGHGTMPEIDAMERAAARIDQLGTQALAIMRKWL